VCQFYVMYMIINKKSFSITATKTATRLPIGSEWLVTTNLLFHIVKYRLLNLRISYDKEKGEPCYKNHQRYQ